MRVSGYKSHRGLCRENNEDSFFVDDVVGAYVVADGIGGNEGGEVASSTAVNTLGKFFSKYLVKGEQEMIPLVIDKALQEANDDIIELRKKRSELSNMGTTVVVSIFFNDLVYYSHLGDSRAYLYRDTGKLTQLTTDDSLVTEMLKQGMINEAEVRNHNLKNIVTRYLGTTPLILPEVKSCRLETGDCILLCSDGLTNMLDENETLSTLKQNISMGPQSICDNLIDKANKNGGYDNITVIAIQSNFLK
ncbi:MAG TPA: Stp1/IreP family PP2C-type Ser/Thr phosphatase [Nitrososphaeraceae archaeon]